MATHSSVLAWRIPQTEEPEGFQSSPRGHRESDRTEQLSTATTRSPKEGGWPLEQPIIFLEGHNFQSHPRPPGRREGPQTELNHQ